MDVCGNSDEPIINIQTKTKILVSLQKRGINMYFYTNPLNNIYWPTDSDGMSSASLKQSLNRLFSLTWPAYMQIYWNKRRRLHKKRVQLPEDWFGTPTWPPLHCFGTPTWPP